MPVLLRKFDTLTNVYIIGTDFKDEQETFSITDDYCSCNIKSEKNKTSIETDGFVFIYTEDELKSNYDKLWGEDSLEAEVYVLKHFTGEITLKVIGRDTDKDMLNSELLNEWFNIKEYIKHQSYPEDNDDDDECLDPEINITGKVDGGESILSLRDVYKSLELPINEN